MTIPEEDLWVNLSPYEKNRVIPDSLNLTDLGKSLLGEDYILKQLVSSLTYPESNLGKKYWDKIYKDVKKIAGITNIPINTFNKIWIIPDKAEVYENGNIALITKARLKVLSEQDYLALNKQENASVGNGPARSVNKDINKISQNALKEIILPQLEYDVNHGENFSKLRQMYHSLVLATWFKKKLKDSIYKHYIDQNKTKGINLRDPTAKDKIYNLYVESFKKGVYDYIKSNYEPSLRKNIKRRYYSGGIIPTFDLKNKLKITSSAIGLKSSLKKLFVWTTVGLSVFGTDVATAKTNRGNRPKSTPQLSSEIRHYARYKHYYANNLFLQNMAREFQEGDSATAEKTFEQVTLDLASEMEQPYANPVTLEIFGRFFEDINNFNNKSNILSKELTEQLKEIIEIIQGILQSEEAKKEAKGLEVKEAYDKWEKYAPEHVKLFKDKEISVEATDGWIKEEFFNPFTGEMSTVDKRAPYSDAQRLIMNIADVLYSILVVDKGLEEEWKKNSRNDPKDLFKQDYMSLVLQGEAAKEPWYRYPRTEFFSKNIFPGKSLNFPLTAGDLRLLLKNFKIMMDNKSIADPKKKKQLYMRRGMKFDPEVYQRQEKSKKPQPQYFKKGDKFNFDSLPPDSIMKPLHRDSLPSLRKPLKPSTNNGSFSALETKAASSTMFTTEFMLQTSLNSEILTMPTVLLNENFKKEILKALDLTDETEREAIFIAGGNNREFRIATEAIAGSFGYAGGKDSYKVDLAVKELRDEGEKVVDIHTHPKDSNVLCSLGDLEVWTKSDYGGVAWRPSKNSEGLFILMPRIHEDELNLEYNNLDRRQKVEYLRSLGAEFFRISPYISEDNSPTIKLTNISNKNIPDIIEKMLLPPDIRYIQKKYYDRFKNASLPEIQDEIFTINSQIESWILAVKLEMPVQIIGKTGYQEMSADSLAKPSRVSREENAFMQSLLGLEDVLFKRRKKSSEKQKITSIIKLAFQVHDKLIKSREVLEVTGRSSSALKHSKGGIDLNPAGFDMKNTSSSIKFNLSPEIIQQWKHGEGITFQILEMKSGIRLNRIIGIDEEKELSHLP